MYAFVRPRPNDRPASGRGSNGDGVVSENDPGNSPGRLLLTPTDGAVHARSGTRRKARTENDDPSSMIDRSIDRERETSGHHHGFDTTEIPSRRQRSASKACARNRGGWIITRPLEGMPVKGGSGGVGGNRLPGRLPGTFPPRRAAVVRSFDRSIDRSRRCATTVLKHTKRTMHHTRK